MAIDKPYKDIPGTTIFDSEQASKGYHLNQFCMSLMKADNRARFKANERAYLDEWPMTEAQKQAESAENTIPLSALSAAPRAAAQPQPQPQLIQTPEAPKVQPLSTYIPSTPEPVVPSFDQTTEHEVVSSSDAGDLDIPDFLR